MQASVIIAFVLLILTAFVAKKRWTSRDAPKYQGVVFCEMWGGLGNQMFEIANAYAFAKRTNKRLIIGNETTCTRPSYWNSWFHQLKQYVGKYAQASEEEMKRYNLHHEKRLNYFQIPQHVTYLRGFYQSTKYFDEYQNEIKRLFSLPDAMQRELKQKYASLTEEESVTKSIVVHIWRTDYLKCKGFLDVLSPAYFERAVKKAKMLTRLEKLVVFSDDLKWCREQAFLRGATFVDELHDVSAMWLMSQFENYVMSNSTFCWWSMYLGREAKFVLAPEEWYGYTVKEPYHDIYLDFWTREPIDKTYGLSNVEKMKRTT